MSERVLIVGIAGGHGRLLARRLRGHCEVIGVDREPGSVRLPDLPFYRADLRKRAFEDVLRRERPTAVVHLGLQRHFRDRPEQRYDHNVRGTRVLLDLCRRYDVAKLVVLSSSYVYGALPENPYFMEEDYPLCGSRNYPEIRDLVEVDALATAFTWRHPSVTTSVLRPVSTLGRSIQSSFRSYLEMTRVWVMMGFNPMIQFIGEDDLIDAIALALERELRGAYNVVGPGEVPLRLAIRETGGRELSIPEFVARPLLRRLYATGLFPFPEGALDYLKFPCTISGKRFAEATGFAATLGLRETLRSMRGRS